MDGTAPGPHKEIEIKLELAPASLRDFKKIPLLRTVKPIAKDESEVSVYFDTANQKLRKNGLMLRVRRHGERRERQDGPFRRPPGRSPAQGAPGQDRPASTRRSRIFHSR